MSKDRSIILIYNLCIRFNEYDPIGELLVNVHYVNKILLFEQNFEEKNPILSKIL